jgi:hypothetical protein
MTRAGPQSAATPAELGLDSHPFACPARHAMLERARITVVQQQHHPPGAAAAHPPVDEFGRHGSRAQPPQPGVSHSEVQLTVFVLDPVTGEMQQQQIIGMAVGEELLHR